LGAWIKKTPSEKRLEKLPDIVRQIAEALHILHERKLIHRDLKPANVLLRSEEPLELVLIDFGISRQIDQEATKHATVVFKGTPAYCAPEEFSGLFGWEADWWHLGIVAYEVIKGEHPFAGVNQAVISYQIITQDIASSGHGGSVSGSFAGSFESRSEETLGVRAGQGLAGGQR
jgi:serine/threonine protein kinase